MIKRIFLLTIVFQLSFQAIQAQKTIEIANKQFENGDFKSALQSYLKNGDGNSYPLTTTIQIARCFEALNISSKSNQWYNKALSLGPEANNYSIEIGKSQMKAGKYVEAKIAFNNYASIDKNLSTHYIAAVDNVENILSNEGSKLSFTNVIQTETNDFAPFMYMNELYYNTNLSNVELDVDARKTMDLEEEGTIICNTKQTPLLKGIFTASNISPITISENNKVAYTSFSNNQSFASRRMENTLYIGEFNKHKLENVKPFPYNKIGSSITDPYLNSDGTILYFSSNMEGGYGGFDLYYSILENDVWSAPVNLGEEVNTQGNEISPNIDHNNYLYFASDFHYGLGGFDIFKAQHLLGEWMNVTNLGLGVNSSNDDYYPFVDVSTNEIYYTSTRTIKNSGEDIYKSILPNREIVMTFGAEPTMVALREENIGQEKTIVTEDTEAIANITDATSSIEVEETIETISEESIVAFNNELNQIVDHEANVPEAVFIGNYEQRRGLTNEVALLDRPRNMLTTKSSAIDMKMVDVPFIEHVPDNDIVDIVPPPAFKIPDFGKTNNLDNSLAKSVSYEGARLVSIGSVLKKEISSVYFVQLAAFYSSQGETTKFEKLSALGNIYKVFAGTAVKIRLGYFNDHNDASQVLSRVKNLGYNDAFLVNADLNTANMELIYSNFNTPNESTTAPSTKDTKSSTPSDSEALESSNNFSYSKPLTPSNSQEYKVRLASYEDPIWFESSKISDLGQLEQWSKGSWTIFILSGYSSYESAEMARIKAVNRGYTDAEVVIDNQGIIERLKKN